MVHLLILDHKAQFALNADPIPENKHHAKVFAGELEKRGAINHDGIDAEGNPVAAKRVYRANSREALAAGEKWLSYVQHFKNGKPYNPSVDEPAIQEFNENGKMVRAMRVNAKGGFDDVSTTELNLLNMKKGLIPMEFPAYLKPTALTPV